MMKVSDLARELHCTVGDIQRAARVYGIAAKDPTFILRTNDVKSIREHIVARRSEEAQAAGGAASSPSAPAPADPLAAIRALAPAVVLPGARESRGEGAVELFYHTDFYYWLGAADTPQRLRQRANLVLRQFLGLGRPSLVKSVAGAGKGWRRTPLGGNGGKQFYLWWAPAGAIPVEHTSLAGNQVLIRAVRHHDETDTGLDAGDPATEWERLLPAELAQHAGTYGFAYSDEQQKIAVEPAGIRLIKGHPGTGKTTTLWLAMEHADGDRALYVTYSKRLAADSRAHFRAFGPRGMAIDVLTFEELLDEFERRGAAEPRPMLAPDEAARRMRVALRAYRGPNEPWGGHPDELYAELHAHFAGRALPIPFRGLGAADQPVLSAEAHGAARRPVIGAAAAKSASSMGAFLHETGALAELMAGPLRARAAVDRLLDGDPLPERLRRLDWIFVDEVQDLTLVESLLLIELARRVGLDGERGRLPGMVIAGDEGQTVRPTDFEWGPLADLLTERLGTRNESILAGNLRSPRNIAAVINASWDLYRKIKKAERPRGYASAEIEETTAGRLIQCRVRSDEEWAVLFDAFKITPGSALVFPGFQVPERFAGHDVWSSDSIKGLDFQVVGVLDAGRQLLRLGELAAQQDGEDGRLAALWARTMADQFRVAISRATDTLVLIDSDDPAAIEEVAKLCRREAAADETPAPGEEPGGEELDGFLQMEAEELAAHLALDDADAQARVVQYLNEIPKILLDRPALAFAQAKRAKGLLHGAKARDAVTDQSMRRDVFRLCGVAALLAAADAIGQKRFDGKLFREANTWLRKAELVEAARAALLVRDLYEQFRPGPAGTAAGRHAHDSAAELARTLDVVVRGIPEAEAVLRQALVVWCRRSVDGELPQTQRQKEKLAEVCADVAERLGGQHPELRAHREALRRRIARALLDEGTAKAALAQFEKLDPRDPHGEAEAHEKLGALEAASLCYERAGDLPAALRCARARGDFERAARLAPGVDPAAARTMEWVANVREAIATRGPSQAPLTDAEWDRLSREIEDALEIAAGRRGRAPVAARASAPRGRRNRTG